MGKREFGRKNVIVATLRLHLLLSVCVFAEDSSDKSDPLTSDLSYSRAFPP
jgi:hypothetical protein